MPIVDWRRLCKQEPAMGEYVRNGFPVDFEHKNHWEDLTDIEPEEHQS
jgi:GTP-binding protein HflX